MPDLPGPVAAILAETPQWDGRIFIGTTQDTRLPHRQNPTWDLTDSDTAQAIAARQAAAVLRWLIAHAEENDWRAHGQMMLDNIATLADEIEETNRG